MFPNVDEAPNLPYEAITSNHHLYDLVYNPAETKFLALGKAQGASTQNGLEMLHLQADASWEIWNSETPFQQ
jgi:shikimate dehydrogenase